ncbi:MAG: sterol desaturase family protein [Alphaproteobacteria bacterium]
MKPISVPYRTLLCLLAGIFVLRVAAQFFLQDHQTPLLPAFEIWHSATLPYSTLLLIQFVTMAVLAAAILATPFKKPHPTTGVILRGLGWIYAFAATLRMIVGSLGLSTHPWFDGALPTAFHFVLAAFVIVFGSALSNHQKTASPNLARYGAYPALMIGAYVLFTWFHATGSPLLFSSYLSVLVAGFGIVLHETFAPAREEWRPNRADLRHDGLFLTLVQVALPAALKAFALLLILGLAGSGVAPFATYWPHNAPTLLQILIMVVIAELFRYWIHRLLHVVAPLWQLHAVHHASDKLYTINVGRFHPFDKSLQFLGDTLPFLLLGLSPEVFAAYFVLYAINGFYQHSNADIRLGPLNWIIAGPELHRWHHSANISEANANYGNNLIIWDVLFGTRFLPKNRQVGRIGIGNPQWPDGFLAQLLAPFTTRTEASRD